MIGRLKCYMWAWMDGMVVIDHMASRAPSVLKKGAVFKIFICEDYKFAQTYFLFIAFSYDLPWPKFSQGSHQPVWICFVIPKTQALLVWLEVIYTLPSKVKSIATSTHDGASLLCNSVLSVFWDAAGWWEVAKVHEAQTGNILYSKVGVDREKIDYFLLSWLWKT